MYKKGSKKLTQWKKSDWVKNVFCYLINTIILLALFTLVLYIGPKGSKGGVLADFVSSLERPLVYALTTVALSVTIFIYFYIEDREFLRHAYNSEMVFLILELSLVITFAVSRFISIYLAPFALPTLIALFLIDKKSSVFVHAIFSILVMMLSLLNAGVGARELLFNLMAFASGIIAIMVLGDKYSRHRLLTRSFFVSIPSLLIVAVSIATGGVTAIWRSLVCALVSGPLSVAGFILLMPFFETLFKKVSCFRLAELTEHKARIIRRMIKEAPGTFNHSVVVSNLAEACATAIEEDALLARTCAYYHDVGKLRRPEFFAENQADGINPHDDMTPELSTNIIRAHAQDGYQLILKHRLPKEIADVCVQHHGTLPILYFYNKAKKFTDGEVDVKKYCYAGPKPQSKIAAIIMIADGCEAASRTLKDRSTANVREVVTKIVNDRMALGQFDECEITIKELNIIIHTIVNNLTGIYHHRIEYPQVTLKGVEHPSIAVEEKSEQEKVEEIQNGEREIVKEESVEKSLEEDKVEVKADEVATVDTVSQTTLLIDETKTENETKTTIAKETQPKTSKTTQSKTAPKTAPKTTKRKTTK